MKVLITGASGFVGYHLIESALARGLDVTAGIRQSSQVGHLSGLAIRYATLDLARKDQLAEELDKGGYDFIIHAAGATKAPTQEAYDAANAASTENLAEAARTALPNLKKLVFLSSLAAIGPLGNREEAITEDTQPNPVTAYGRSKLLAERRLAIQPLPWLVLRPTAVYGPRDKDIFILLRLIRRGWEPYIGKAPQRLSFVYVKDLSDLAVHALFTEHTHRFYNVTDGRAYDRYELAGIVKAYFHRRTLKFFVPVPLVKIIATGLERVYERRHKSPALNREKLQELTAPNWVCRIDSARRELGFWPDYDLKNGLEETLEWYLRNGWL
ncbi:NAD-dependent epimerase/dehydratase family protein [Dinghuibacter silviterrae]|uniref:Nucleoside-diphosphate-sugar epimerase n=1 Tax=Dinghuibacter silviterrae TaxID=1539049 RepID=A0A4R8DTM7_9BACT|nr:NAD(P)-dependent oxidoreductase [Dinghuibacter silviterrae]TDX01672.1 nucleoside-diphosphate-sugar epimerase [Dinghuibacter silviterrae]